MGDNDMSRRKIIISILSLTVVFLAFAGCGGHSGKGEEQLSADEYFKRGLSFAKSKHYDEAIEAFNKTLEMEPRHENAYWGRGVAWAMKGEPDKAIADYNKALEINPCHPWAYYNRGCAWRDKGEYDQAIADYTNDLELNPRNAVVSYSGPSTS